MNKEDLKNSAVTEAKDICRLSRRMADLLGKCEIDEEYLEIIYITLSKTWHLVYGVEKIMKKLVKTEENQ